MLALAVRRIKRSAGISWRRVTGAVLGVTTLAALGAEDPAPDVAAPAPPGRPAITVSSRFLEVAAGSFPGAPAAGGKARVMPARMVADALREMEGRDGVQLLSAPRVTTFSGQRAAIMVGREFVFPEAGKEPKLVGLSVEVTPVQMEDKIQITAQAAQCALKVDPVPAGEAAEFTEQQSSAAIFLGNGESVILAPLPAKKAGREVIVVLEAEMAPPPRKP